MKPILFQPQMVAAILAGNKTMTRRLANQPGTIQTSLPDWDESKFVIRYDQWMNDDDMTEPAGPDWLLTTNEEDEWSIVHFFRPKYRVGDILWVRESHFRFGYWEKNGLTKTGKQKFKFHATTPEIKYPDNPPEKFKTSRDKKAWATVAWYKRSSLFMPFAACRLFLKVTSVKVERLQDITHEDSMREGIISERGVSQMVYANYKYGIDKKICDLLSAPESFKSLWQSINGPESWAASPWVFAYTFQITDKPTTI